MTVDNRQGVAGLVGSRVQSGELWDTSLWLPFPWGELALGKAHFEVELVRPQEILWCERTLKLCLFTVVTNDM